MTFMVHGADDEFGYEDTYTLEPVVINFGEFA